ncbi:MAG: undecaprenyl-phosphate glucose phosphotransferase [Planctomycetia bacterium]|nr:undecaprenyl-phosphate glucose phosphotransferase [Planctomycetia bacterium]
MLPSNRQLLVFWFLLWDLLVISVVFYLQAGEEFISKWVAILSLAALSLAVCKLYVLHRLRRAREELVSLLQAMALWLLTLYVIEPLPGIHRSIVLYLVVLVTFGLFLFRRLWWLILGNLRAQGYNATPVVIVGTGRVARRTARAMEHAGWMGMHVIGFIEDEPTRWTSDLPIIGNVSDLPRLVLEHGISQVFIALPLQRYHEARRVYETLSQSIVEIRLILDAAPLTPLSFSTTKVDGLTFIGLRDNPHLGLNRAVKRTMDLVLGSLALLLSLPMMLLIACLVKLTSKGPVFYRQERCGLNGQRFQMIKFRTMRLDAEQSTGPIWATAGDSRTTRLGQYLRKWNLDELPQLFNVLKGEMSLVGPRPERPVFIERFRKTVPNYMARHMVKAGMTGWAQVQGWRGNTSLRQRIRHDLYYITHWNPWFDLRIMVLTVLRGFSQKNAY